MWLKGLRSRGWSLVLAAGVVNAACLNLHPPPEPVPPDLAGAAPAERWDVSAARGVSEPLVLSGRLVIAGAANRQLTAIDMDSGKVVWRQRMPGAITGGVLAHNGMLLVGTSRPEGKIDALSAAGRRIWRTSSGDITTPLTTAGEMVVAMNARGELVAFNLSNGRLRWRRPLGLSRTAPLGLQDGTVLVTTHDSLFRVEVSAGRVVARAATVGPLPGGWRLNRFGAVAGLADGRIIAVDPTTLDTRWTIHAGGPVTGPLAIRGDTIWAATRSGRLLELTDHGDGALRRTVADLAQPTTTGVARVDDVLVIGTADGRIRGIDRDGRESWRVGIYPSVEVTPLPSSSGFVAAGGNGHIHLFEFE